MDKLAKYNKNANFLLFAVNCLSRYLCVEPFITKFATEAALAFKKMIKHKQNIGLMMVQSFLEPSKPYATKEKFIYTALLAKTSRQWQSGTFENHYQQVF